jgi:hypothetical protein
MTTISIISIPSVTEARADDYSLKTIALFCCVGLVASLGLMTFGMDLSAGWLYRPVAPSGGPKA